MVGAISCAASSGDRVSPVAMGAPCVSDVVIAVSKPQAKKRLSRDDRVLLRHRNRLNVRCASEKLLYCSEISMSIAIFRALFPVVL